MEAEDTENGVSEEAGTATEHGGNSSSSMAPSISFTFDGTRYSLCERSSCKGRLGSDTSELYACQCDRFCMLARDCCLDYFLLSISFPAVGHNDDDSSDPNSFGVSGSLISPSPAADTTISSLSSQRDNGTKEPAPKGYAATGASLSPSPDNPSTVYPQTTPDTRSNKVDPESLGMIGSSISSRGISSTTYAQSALEDNHTHDPYLEGVSGSSSLPFLNNLYTTESLTASEDTGSGNPDPKGYISTRSSVSPSPNNASMTYSQFTLEGKSTEEPGPNVAGAIGLSIVPSQAENVTTYSVTTPERIRSEKHASTGFGMTRSSASPCNASTTSSMTRRKDNRTQIPGPKCARAPSSSGLPPSNTFISARQAADLIRKALASSSSPDFDGAPNLAYFLLHSQCLMVNENNFTVVTSCPLETIITTAADPILKAQCENSSLLLPVSHKLHHAIVFRNAQCASCHGLDSSRTVTWSGSLRCSPLSANASVQELIHAYKANLCKVVYNPPTLDASGPATGSPRRCSLLWPKMRVTVEALSSGNSSSMACSQDDELLCKAYRLPFHLMNHSADGPTMPGVTPVVNPHCSKCLTGYVPEQLGETFCNLFAKRISSYQAVGFAVLFDLSEDGSGVFINGKLVKWPGFRCEGDEEYDYVDNVCRKIICSMGYELLDKQCVRSDTLVDRGTQLLPAGTGSLWLQLRLVEGVDCRSAETLRMAASARDTFKEHKLPGPLSDEQLHTHLSCSEDDIHLNIFMNRTERNDFSKLYKSLISLIDRLTISCDTVLMDMALTNSERLNLTGSDHDNVIRPLCLDGRHAVLIDNANLTEREDTLYIVITKHDFKQFYPLENVLFQTAVFCPQRGLNRNCRSINTARESKLIRAMVCEQIVFISSLSCPAHEYPKNQTSVENGILTIFAKDGTEMTFLPNEYEVREFSVLACSRFKKSSDFWDNFVFAQYTEAQIQAQIGLHCMSVVSLIIVVFFYALLPELSTLPGKLILCLTACLLVAHVSLSLKFPNRLACRIVAVIMHFSWLAAFTWVSAMAVHMAHTFCAPSAGRATRQEMDKAFRRYSLVCWGLPLAFVATCFVLDLSPSAGIRLGYGERACGYMGEVKAIILAFFGPLGVSLAINLSSFTVAVIGIERTSRASRLARSRRSEARRLLVYVKMSTAMGFTWLLSLAAAFLHYPWLWWLNLVANSLQGTFLALAFLANERVLQMLKKKLAGKPALTQNFATSSSTGVSHTQASLAKVTKKPR